MTAIAGVILRMQGFSKSVRHTIDLNFIKYTVQIRRLWPNFIIADTFPTNSPTLSTIPIGIYHNTLLLAWLISFSIDEPTLDKIPLLGFANNFTFVTIIVLIKLIFIYFILTLILYCFHVTDDPIFIFILITVLFIIFFYLIFLCIFNTIPYSYFIYFI